MKTCTVGGPCPLCDCYPLGISSPAPPSVTSPGNWPQWKLVVKHLAVTTSGLLVVALSVENHCTNISCYHLGFHGQEKRRNRRGENISHKNAVLHLTHFIQDTHIRPSSAAHASRVGSRQPAVLPEWVQRHGAELQFSVTE